MEADGEKNKNAKPSKGTDPTILDKVNFYLAEKLLGPKSIENFGIQSDNFDDDDDGDGNTMTDSLYWRSELLIDKPTMVKPSPTSTPATRSDDDKGDDSKLAFMDITFYLKIEDDNTIKIESQFGCFLFHRPSSEYVTAKILTLTQLERHADSVGIFLDGASAKGVAELMAAGLLRSDASSSENPPLATKVVNDDDDDGEINGQLDLSIFYKDLKTYGVFNLDIEYSSSQFDFHGLNLLMRFSEGRNMGSGGIGENAEKNKPSTVEGGESEDDSFDIWGKRVLAQLAKKLEDDAKKNASANAASTCTSGEQKKKNKRTDGKDHNHNNKRRKKKRKNQLTFK